MELKYIKYNNSIFYNLCCISFILIFGLIVYGNQFNRYWSFSDLSQYSYVNLYLKIYDFRNFGGINFNTFNLFSIIENELNKKINNQQLISFLIFSILSFINYSIYEYSINKFKKSYTNGLIYAINPFTALSFANISNNIYQYYALIPLIFLIVVYVIDNINVKKIIKIICILSFQFYFIFLHPSFLVLTLYILFLSYLIRLYLFGGIKNFFVLTFVSLVLLSGVILISLIGVIDPLISNSVNSETMVSVFTTNSVDFWNLISLNRYPSFFRLSNSIIGIISLILIYNLFIRKKFINNSLSKYYLIFFIILILFTVNLYELNFLRNYLFENIILFWPFRTNDKLIIFLPFLILGIANQINISDFLKVFVKLFKYIIIILCLFESLHYNKINIIKNEALSKYNISFNSPRSNQLEEVANIINNDPGFTLILSSRSKKNLIGWVELPEINLLGKHPFFDLLSTKSIIDDDYMLTIGNKQFTLRNIIEHNDANVIYNILRLTSFKYIFIDKYSDITTYKNNVNHIKKLLKHKKIIKYFENESGIVYQLIDSLNAGYYISINPNEIFFVKDGKISLTSKLFKISNNAGLNNDQFNYYILNTKYSYFWFNNVTKLHSSKSIFETNLFITDDKDVNISFIFINNSINLVK